MLLFHALAPARCRAAAVVVLLLTPFVPALSAQEAAHRHGPGIAEPAADGHVHAHGPETLTISDVLALEINRDAARRSGSDGMVFEVAVRSDVLPEAVRTPGGGHERPLLTSAHGGFAYDHREGRGEVYWFLRGAGILRIDARDRSRIELLPTPEEMKALNMHNATFFEHDGAPHIAWPAERGGRVFVTDLDGRIEQVVPRPEVPEYANAKTPYAPTDTAYLDGRLWVTDGYGSKYIMAWDLDREAWTDVVFGGRAKEPVPGRFGTNHGLTIRDNLLYVAGRYFARIHSYRPDTRFAGMFRMPEGSRPCDFEFFALGDRLYGVAASLDKAKGTEQTGAAIYVVDMETLEIVSTVLPKDELGLEKFVHLHNVFPTVEDGRVTLFCQAWNPGDFAVLRQVR